MKIKKSEFKGFLREAFNAGDNYRDDCYWGDFSNDFASWYDRTLKEYFNENK